MPNGSWQAKIIKCPFYIHDDKSKRTITCEGVFDRTKATSKFRRQSDREKQLMVFCAEEFERCEIYRAIMEAKYPDE